MIELTPKMEPESSEPIYMQLYRYIREEIAEGRISAQARLPSVRRLADHLGVSRTPVALAYEQLTAEGYLLSRPRSGLYVADIAVEQMGFPPGDQKAHLRPAFSCPQPLSAYADLQRAYHDSDSEGSGAIRYDFGYGRVDLASFPLAKWRRYMNRVLVPENGFVLLYGDLQGERGLREERITARRSGTGAGDSRLPGIAVQAAPAVQRERTVPSRRRGFACRGHSRFWRHVGAGTEARHRGIGCCVGARLVKGTSAKKRPVGIIRGSKTIYIEKGGRDLV